MVDGTLVVGNDNDNDDVCEYVSTTRQVDITPVSSRSTATSSYEGNTCDVLKETSCSRRRPSCCCCCCCGRRGKVAAIVDRSFGGEEERRRLEVGGTGAKAREEKSRHGKKRGFIVTPSSLLIDFPGDRFT